MNAAKPIRRKTLLQVKPVSLLGSLQKKGTPAAAVSTAQPNLNAPKSMYPASVIIAPGRGPAKPPPVVKSGVANKPAPSKSPMIARIESGATSSRGQPVIPPMAAHQQISHDQAGPQQAAVWKNRGNLPQPAQQQTAGHSQVLWQGDR